MASLRLVGPVHPKAVPLARQHAGQIGVAYERIGLAQFDGCLRTVVVQQTQFDPTGGLGEDREICPGAVVRGAEWVSLSRPHLHGQDSSTSARGTEGLFGQFLSASQILPEKTGAPGTSGCAGG